jgi:hypothetical protein
MARDISEIYGGIIDTKNSRNELNGLNSTSQTAIYKLWAYCTAVAIYSHELLFDIHQEEINATLDSRINGTSPWYAGKALEYQDGDELLVLNGGTSLGYNPVIPDNRIITRCTYFEDLVGAKGRLNLKVAKGDTSNLSDLDLSEKSRVVKYFEKIKFAGTNINIISIPADEIVLEDVTIFHDGVRTDEQIQSDVDDAMDDYLVNLPFDGMFYIEAFRDRIQLVDNIVDVYIVSLSRNQYSGNGAVNQDIIRRVPLDAGYAKIARGDADPVITITIES